MIRRLTCFKKTPDQGYPSLEITDRYRTGEVRRLVEVSLHGKRVAAWGDDDFGLGKDTGSHRAALALYLEVLALPQVSIKTLRRLGFTED